ncbi:hypothetical protein [Aquibacillus saliphilus]|uniref:hypothetical protein n=1 Tax=Aquibacillus saliphilus TaxID=1909422 RepID=UPI001CF02B4D|nr:hypothetical protein [Aquibacillus saliphilus]
MVFMVGEVEVITKAKEVITGVLMPIEDVQGLSDHYPILDLIGKSQKNTGIYIFTGKTISFINKNEIQEMKCLRFT